MDGSSISAGPVLRFSVTGDGVSINPETGELSLLTDSLLEGFAVTVTLADESGTVSRVFRLAMNPVEAASGTTPQPTAQPILEGTGEIGTVVTVDPGQWSGTPEPEIVLQWCLDGEAIAGASAVEYLPAPADDGRSLSCRVTARNAAGSASAETEALEVRFAAPTAVDVLADLAAIEGEEPLVVEAAAVFAGDGLTFAVTGAEATIDAATGRLTIPTAAARAAETITVTATNSGGTASVQFQVAIEPRAADVPGRIPATLWSADEVRDEAPEGRRRVSISPEVAIPAGFELRLYSGPERLASQPSLNTTRAMQPGETFTTRGGLPIGTVCHNLLFWHRPEDGAWTQASQSAVVFEIIGLQPAEPAEPQPVAPAVLSAPVLAGSGKIDSELAVDTGTWSGEPEIVLQWLRDEAPIPDATAAVYVPVPEDDLTKVCCRVTARNAAGETEAKTEVVLVTYVAPVPIGELPDEIFDEDTGAQEVPTAQAFDGRNLAFTVSGEGASIDVATGVVTIDTTAPGVETITVAAANSGGEAMQSFLVTVEALPAIQPEPSTIAADLWLFEAEAWSAEQGGARMSITSAAAIKNPEGFELRGYIGSNPAGVGAANMTVALAPGTKFTTNGFFSGDLHARLFWREVATDAFQIADEAGKVLTVAAPDTGSSKTSGKLPAPTSEMLAQATAMPHPRYLPTLAHSSGAGTTNNGLNGFHPVTLALGEMQGALTAEQRSALISRLRFVVAGRNEPACEGGYPAQHELNAFAMAAICRHLPIWNSLSETEKACWDVVMKGGLFAHGYIMSTNNPDRLANAPHPHRNLRNVGNNVWAGGNPNHRCGYIGAMLACAMYFGKSQSSSLMDNFALADFVAEAEAAGMAHIADTFRRTWSGAPTARQIEAAVRDWTYRHGGQTLNEIAEIIISEVHYCFDREVIRGLNEGAGIDGCGTTISKSNPPNFGVVGMAREFNAVDGRGPRSDIRYVIGGVRPVIQMVLLAAARGVWDAASPAAQAAMARMNIGMTDLIWKQRVAGYRDYANGSCRKIWSADSSADRAEWGLTYTWGMWETVLKPYHEIGATITSPPEEPEPAEPGETFMATTAADRWFSDIRFTASASRAWGRYAMGDLWTRDGVSITRTTPESVSSGGRIVNGAQVDMGRWPTDPGYRSDRSEEWNRLFSPERQGADDAVVSNGGTANTIIYREECNRAPERKGPITVGAGQEATITKFISQVPNSDDRRTTTGMAHLTVVSATPAADAFRPSPIAASKASRKRVADMHGRVSQLPNLPLVGNFADDEYGSYATLLRWLERPHNHSHIQNGTKQNVFPIGSQVSAGREYARVSGSAALLLCTNAITSTQKLELAKAVCQQGLDIYEAAIDGRVWQDNGQLLQGRKILLALAAWFFDDADMKRYAGTDTSLYRRVAIPQGRVWGGNHPIFSDDRQIHIVQQSWVNDHGFEQRTVGHPWWQDKLTWNSGSDSPADARSPNHRYRVQYTTHCYAQALATQLIPGLRAIWNWQRFFDHCDYFRNFDFAKDMSTPEWHQRNSPALWHRAMWDAYRSQGGPIYPHSY